MAVAGHTPSCTPRRKLASPSGAPPSNASASGSRAVRRGAADARPCRMSGKRPASSLSESLSARHSEVGDAFRGRCVAAARAMECKRPTSRPGLCAGAERTPKLCRRSTALLPCSRASDARGASSRGVLALGAISPGTDRLDRLGCATLAPRSERRCPVPCTPPTGMSDSARDWRRPPSADLRPELRSGAPTSSPANVPARERRGPNLTERLPSTSTGSSCSC